MITFTLTHGLSRNLSDEASPETTIGSLLSNNSYKAVLKFGESVDAVVNGVVQNTDTTLGDLGNNITIAIETKSNSKA